MGSVISIAPIKYWSLDRVLGRSRFDTSKEIWVIRIGDFDDYECGPELVYMYSSHYLKCKNGIWSMRVLNRTAIAPLPQIELLDESWNPVPLVHADDQCVVY